MEGFVNTAGAARFLGVSSGTVYNWKRRGLITAGKNGFLLEHLSLLKDDLESGRIPRLRSRANKTGSPATFLPGEYLENPSCRGRITGLIAQIQKRNIAPETAAFCLILNRFTVSGDIVVSCKSSPADCLKGDFKRSSVEALMKRWYGTFSPGELDNESLNFILEWELPWGSDIPGIIYQSLLHEGRKSQQGSYYTPPVMAREMAESTVRDGMKVLDPCCGTGQFLLAASGHISDPESLYGWDIDSTAVMIASANLLYAYPGRDFTPNVRRVDSLAEGPDVLIPGSVDCIITNPPWGMKIPDVQKRRLERSFPGIHSGESFSYFLILSIELLKPSGRLSFVLPESVTNIRVHEDIRMVLLEQTNIERIRVLGRRFHKVFSKVIYLTAEKCGGDLSGAGNPGVRSSCTRSNRVRIVHPHESFQVSQGDFSANTRSIINIYASPRDRRIIASMYRRRHISLENNALWGLGIVTGDNSSFLFGEPGDGREAVYTGSDVEPFTLKPAKKYICFARGSFQQCAPESLYRAPEKLIYRFIASRPVFAYDSGKCLTLNSANICIPRVEGLSMLCIMGLLNSDLYAFLYEKQFHTIRVLRGDLESLPLPLLSDEEHRKLEGCVRDIREGGMGISGLNSLVFDLFNIPGAERSYISSGAGKP